jgi:hypothetical protein
VVGLGAFVGDPNLERLAVYLGLLLGLGLSIKNGLRGWANIYPKLFPEGENYWGEAFWRVVGPLMLTCLFCLLVWQLIPTRLREVSEKPFPNAFWLMGLVLLVQNIIAQMITGPFGERRELHFSIYYLFLLMISGSIICYIHFTRAAGSSSRASSEAQTISASLRANT